MALIKPYVDQLLEDRDTLATNIAAKGVPTEEDETITSLAEKVSDIPAPTESSGVFFIDYDGTQIEFWGASTVVSKTELPTNPTHTGLTAQGWNWTLNEIQNYVASYPEADVIVGQTYTTTSGLTEFDITLTKITGLTVTCNMVGTKNWGDGSEEDDLTTHTYEDYGDYTITCDGTSIPAGSSSSGSGLFGTGDYCVEIRFGRNVANLPAYVCYKCYSLKNVILPNTIKFNGNYVFYYCYNLKGLVIPRQPSTTSLYQYTFSSCYTLKIISLAPGISTLAQNTFHSCYSLEKITIPDTIRTLGKFLFNYDRALIKIVLPSYINSIDTQVFNDCRYLKDLISYTSVVGHMMYSNCNLENAIFKNGITSIGNQSFANTNIKNLVLSSSLTGTGTTTCSGCYLLENVTFSLTSINSEIFYNCPNLKNLTMLGDITSIGAKAFSDCHSMRKYDFTNCTTVPTLANVNAFTSINALCKIVVPDDLYDDWIVATNWSTYANYIIKASEYEE